MISEEQLQGFIEDRVVTLFSNIKSEKNIYTNFVLTYYDSFALLALTQSNIIFLDEEVMQLVKPHKKKLFFRIIYDPNFRTFELRTLIFASPLTQCIRVVTEIKKILAKHNIGSRIDTLTFLAHRKKKTYTNIDILKILD